MHAVARDWREADLSAPDLALCGFADKLTRAPRNMAETDIIALRDQGFSDEAIHDATQVISYFNYINRVADALDVDQENGIRAWEKKPEQ